MKGSLQPQESRAPTEHIGYEEGKTSLNRGGRTYTFIVYAKDPPKIFSGILGEIDLHTLQFLLVGGKYSIEETYSGTDPTEWYTGILEQQDIFIVQGKQQKYKGETFIWLEVDLERTPIQEFTSWKDLSDSDEETLAWRTFYYPCYKGTVKECLGFAISAREIYLQKNKRTLQLNTVIDAILSSDSCTIAVAPIN